MNSNQLKRHLLVGLIGLSFFNIFMLIVVILLIIFVPTLLHRCADWKVKSELQRHQHFMKKLNLIEQPPLSDIETLPHQPLPAVPKIFDTNVAIMTPSYAELLHQLEAQKQLGVQLTRDLQAKRALHRINTFAQRSGIR